MGRAAQSNVAPTAAETLDEWIAALTSELNALDRSKHGDRVKRLTCQLTALIERRAQVDTARR